MKVLLIDDHPMLRKGLRQALEPRADIVVVGEAATGTAALGLVQQTAPDLIVVDIHLPDMKGVELIRRLAELAPFAKIVVFSSDADRKLVDESLHAGASGYIWKQSAVEELLQAVQMVMAGKLYLSPEVSTGILDDYRRSLVNGTDSSRPILSGRDKDLLRFVADGLRNKEIASHLKISPKSVEAYRSRLGKKLGCSSTAQLIRYAVREGLVEP